MCQRLDRSHGLMRRQIGLRYGASRRRQRSAARIASGQAPAIEAVQALLGQPCQRLRARAGCFRMLPGRRSAAARQIERPANPTCGSSYRPAWRRSSPDRLAGTARIPVAPAGWRRPAGGRAAGGFHPRASIALQPEMVPGHGVCGQRAAPRYSGQASAAVEIRASRAAGARRRRRSPTTAACPVR